MTGVIIRIALRYIAAFFIAKGILSPEDGKTFITDPDVIQVLELGVGIAIGAVTEAYYWAARKFGWST